MIDFLRGDGGGNALNRPNKIISQNSASFRQLYWQVSNGNKLDEACWSQHLYLNAGYYNTICMQHSKLLPYRLFRPSLVRSIIDSQYQFRLIFSSLEMSLLMGWYYNAYWHIILLIFLIEHPFWMSQYALMIENNKIFYENLKVKNTTGLKAIFCCLNWFFFI